MSVTDGFQVRVAAKREEAAGICGFDLVRSDGGALPPFSAGSHIDVMIPGGPTRQYSLCNSPAESHRYQIAVLRDPNSRGGSAGMHERVVIGDMLWISAPRNHFALARDAERHLLLAGGIGVTPLLCMAESLSASGAQFEMHYCARSRACTAFLERIRQSRYAAQVRLHFDDDHDDPPFDLAALLARQGGGPHLYVCGPQGFMDAVLQAARAAGWPENRLHHEFFTAAPRASAVDESFEVEIASSGEVVVVGACESVVQALARAGIEIETSCGLGVCGTCATRVLAGEPEHCDVYLTSEQREANDQFLPCCSRAKSRRLVLDL